MRRAEGVRVAYPLFQAGGGGSTPTSALQLRFDPLDLRTAKQLVRLWHSRLPRFGGQVPGGFGYGAEFDGLFYAVAVWSLPVARLLPNDGSCLELRRLAVGPDAPKNTASRMLGWMVRDIARRRPGVNRLVSYQDTEVHTGGIYRAAGWTAAALSQGDTWDRPNRHRRQTQSDAPKVRWEKALLVNPSPGPSREADSVADGGRRADG